MSGDSVPIVALIGILSVAAKTSLHGLFGLQVFYFGFEAANFKYSSHLFGNILNISRKSKFENNTDVNRRHFITALSLVNSTTLSTNIIYYLILV